ncbi:MAG: hypothetical protein IKN80_02005 [Clostridiales bacterium]|nr:hypothetical protein [Clostridiales bacterium]
MSTIETRRKARGNVINLSRNNSLMAVIACLVTTGCSFYAIAGGMVLYVQDDLPAMMIFQWYTTISNSITCLSACMIIPFAVEGYRKKHFSLPRWVTVLYYAGMVSTTLTMFVTLCFISWNNPVLAFGGYNSYLHIICPIMVIICFFMIESGYMYTVRDAAFTVIPTVLYVMLYIIEVVVIGEEHGGWEDLYGMLDYVPVPVAVISVPLIAFGVSNLVRVINNSLVKKRRRKLLDSLLPQGVKPAEIKIEMFGLGRYMGKHSDLEYVELHMDLISMISEQYGIKAEDLARPYVKGFFDSFNEKNNV